jgi:hypothetical protein
LNYPNEVVDFLIKNLSKKKNNQYSITYLGPRKNNSYLLHECRNYPNPYPSSKKVSVPFTKQSELNTNI